MVFKIDTLLHVLDTLYLFINLCPQLPGVVFLLAGNAGFISEQSTINYINQRKNEQSTAFSMENHNKSARVRSLDDGHYLTSEREALEGYCDAIDGVQNARSYPMGSHSNNDYGNSRVIRNDSNFGTKGRESHQARPIPSGQMSVQ